VAVRARDAFFCVYIMMQLAVAQTEEVISFGHRRRSEPQGQARRTPDVISDSNFALRFQSFELNPGLRFRQDCRSKAGGTSFRYANRTRPKYRRLGKPYCMLKRLCSADLAHFRLRFIESSAKFHPDSISTTQFKISSILDLVKGCNDGS